MPDWPNTAPWYRLGIIREMMVRGSSEQSQALTALSSHSTIEELLRSRTHAARQDLLRKRAEFEAIIEAIEQGQVDVAVIGLGAAGGVAVLPLARAGLKIAGIEAGGWMDPHAFRPDEIYNNVRRLVTSVPKAQKEIPTVRSSPSVQARQPAFHPMMN